MESTDREILLEINGRLQSLEAWKSEENTRLGHLEARFGQVEVNQAVMHDAILVNTTRLDGLQNSLYWGFAILGIIIAFVPLWRGRRSESPAPTPKDDKWRQ